ncbi:MAG: copper chaperone PCu(A)C [Chloroflexi bacterium]|nr:copper chaperone PCu(A)C [Chloroflexota bacterium]
MKTLPLMLLMLLASLLTACGAPAPDAPAIEIEDPWVRAAPYMNGQNNSAAYLVIRNSGKQPDTLLGVEAAVSQVVELHTSQTKNGITMMSAVENMEVPARGKTELKPGGLHIMLIQLTQDLNPGDTVHLTLIFETSGRVEVAAPVREP